ncbi:MAG TPA: DUF5686 and carboxypeptidase regulatory-like domain-containing protein [Bacteroidales bacterium]|nr:DUF5686 and carboxypeptidase regulatory-like domain-containing protein [Bacteroidales bacterium]
MRKIIFTLIFGFIYIQSYSQGIKGKIKDTNGKPIAFATIYAPDISKGTTSNLDGDYKLDLPQGNHHIVIRYLGYKTREMEINYTGEEKKLDIVLQEQAYKIPEVRILASGEDPAYPIMKKAIAMSYYYLNQVEEYWCRIYLKGSGKVIEIPRLLQKTFKKEGIEEHKPIVIENITDVHFKLPNILKENTVSLRSTFEGTDASPMSYITLSLYNDIDGVISPLSSDAFAYYKYQLNASFYDQDYLVHKIKVIPRRAGYDLYSGYIYIVEGFWHLYSVELKLEQKMFTIDINQVYTPVEDDVWMPISHDFDIDVKFMGVEFTFKYVASVFDYKVQLNTQLDHSVYRAMLAESKAYAKEIDEVIAEEKSKIAELVSKDNLTKKETRKLKKLVKEDVSKTIPEKDLQIKDRTHVDDSANLRSVEYWDSIRPIPLTEEEMISYEVKDSIQLRMEKDSTFNDSVKRKESRFSWRKLFTGGTFSYNDGHSFRYGGLFDFSRLDYNTVDGLKYGMYFSYQHQNEEGKYFRISQQVDYAFARERMTSYFSTLYRYNGIKRGYISLAGGRRTSDFDRRTGISKNLNLITTLFLKENYLKLYQEDFISIGHHTDIANGLNFSVGFKYAQRKELTNHADFYLTNPFDNDFTSNIPPVSNFNSILVNSHNASLFDTRISYTPRYFYRINKGVKWYVRSKYPTFSLQYNKGIKNLFNSDIDFDQLEFSVRQGLHIRRIGGLTYNATAGTFFNNHKVYFADYKHFATNTPFLIGASEGSMFRLLDYYDYSTNKSYFEGNVRLESDRILLKRLPVLNKTLMRESIYFNYLATTGNKPYYEVGYSLNQIFLLFSVEVFAGFKGTTHKYTGIKIGVPFVGRSGNTITIGG